MIYTLTINPALDYVIQLEDFVAGEVNRAEDSFINAGGKGINVSTMLSSLGSENTALGYVAGFTGNVLVDMLDDLGIKTDFIHLDEGFTRINVKIKARIESELNGNGPVISKEKLEELFEKLDALTEKDYLVLAGSIPTTLSSDLYETIIKRLEDKKVNVIIDATKDLLLKTLKYRPFLIKPNHKELGELFGVTCSNEEDIIKYARKLQEKGARNVLVSRAADGAVLIDENGSVTVSDTPKGKVVNSVGAGDSMVAGFLHGYLTTGKYSEALKYGIASGSASAFSKAIASKEKVMESYSTL